MTSSAAAKRSIKTHQTSTTATSSSPLSVTLLLHGPNVCRQSMLAITAARPPLEMCDNVFLANVTAVLCATAVARAAATAAQRACFCGLLLACFGETELWVVCVTSVQGCAYCVASLGGKGPAFVSKPWAPTAAYLLCTAAAIIRFLYNTNVDLTTQWTQGASGVLFFLSSGLTYW